MGRHRLYATDALRQAACRQRKSFARLRQIPQVHGAGYTVYQGDALALVPLLGAVDHCITDPPYEEEAHTRMRRTRAKVEGRAPYAPVNFAPITERQRRLVVRLRCRWLLVFCQVEAVGRYQALLGPHYKRALVWRKSDGAPQFTGDRPGMGYETIVAAWGQPGKSSWNRGGQHGWYEGAPPETRLYDFPVRDGAQRVHPTQKPLPLMRALVRDFTQAGDLVLDPFMGSGTTGVACLQEGRRFVGIEQDPATFAVACRRLADAARQGQLFPTHGRAVQAALL